MNKRLIAALLLSLTTMTVSAEDELDLETSTVTGNRELPRVMVIVPWKSSDPGDRIGVSRILDDGRRPVDRDVFMRELEYYQIGVESFEGLDPGSR